MTTTLKTLAASALVAVAGSAAFAATPLNTFDIDTNQEIDRVIEIANVNAASNGLISIYEYSAGERGALLGTVGVDAGNKDDLRVLVPPYGMDQALVVLTIDGQEVYVDEIS